MCGRFVTPEEMAIERAWGLTSAQGAAKLRAAFAELLKPRYDVRPTNQVILIRNSETQEIETADARWGLIPHWWKDEKPPNFTFNARIEEADAKPMWRDAFRRNRCLV